MQTCWRKGMSPSFIKPASDCERDNTERGNLVPRLSCISQVSPQVLSREYTFQSPLKSSINRTQGTHFRCSEIVFSDYLSGLLSPEIVPYKICHRSLKGFQMDSLGKVPLSLTQSISLQNQCLLILGGIPIRSFK